MTEFKVLVLDDSGRIVVGQRVKVCKEGFDKTCYYGDTGQDGIATLNFNALNEGLRVEIEGLSNANATAYVNILGQAEPPQVTLTKRLQPADAASDAITGITKYLKGLGTIATIIAVIAIIFLAWYYGRGIVKKGISKGKEFVAKKAAEAAT